MRSLPLIALSILVCSCAPRPAEAPASPAGVKVTHDLGSRGNPAHYTLTALDGRVLGTAPSIIDKERVSNVPGLPVSQTFTWSPTGKTLVIYENMSDASPDYRHLLVRQRADSDGFDAQVVNLGSRSGYPDSYGDWPEIDHVTDTRIGLRWSTAPTMTTIAIADLEFEQADDGTGLEGEGATER